MVGKDSASVIGDWCSRGRARGKVGVDEEVLRVPRNHGIGEWEEFRVWR
jgi:hypothetical protein